MPDSDEQLIANLRATGDMAHMDQLVRRHLDDVWVFAYRIVLDRSAADDVTQDVFVNVIRNVSGFRGDATFKTWLFRITANTAKTHLRKQRRATKSVVDSSNDLQTRLDAQQTQLSPDHNSIQLELLNDIHVAMSRLTASLRTAIVLTSTQNMSVSEAAQVEGCSKATMYWRIHQARRQLKQHLHQHVSQ